MYYVHVDVSRSTKNGAPTFLAVVRRHKKKKLGRASSLPGEALGWYELMGDGNLGEGACGHVHLAQHRLTGMFVAIKTIHKARYDELNMEFPPAEIKLLEQLQHPNICQLYHSIHTSQSVHLVLEAVEGDLFDYCLERGPLPETEIRALFRQIVSAVGYMHSKLICHRDLKAENILLGENLQVKIIDIGLGNFFDNSGEALLETFCGSPDYSAPEVWERRPYYGPHVDIWAMGVLLFVLATSYLPFNTPSNICDYRYGWPTKCSASASFRSLVSGIFKPIDQRLSLDGIVRHPWMLEDGGPVVSYHPANTKKDLDMDIVRQMEGYGFTQQEVQESLGQTNQISATYYLLERKKKKCTFRRRSSSGGGGTPIPAVLQ